MDKAFPKMLVNYMNIKGKLTHSSVYIEAHICGMYSIFIETSSHIILSHMILTNGLSKRFMYRIHFTMYYYFLYCFNCIIVTFNMHPAWIALNLQQVPWCLLCILCV